LCIERKGNSSRLGKKFRKEDGIKILGKGRKGLHVWLHRWVRIRKEVKNNL